MQFLVNGLIAVLFFKVNIFESFATAELNHLFPRPDLLPDPSADLNQGIEDSRRKAAGKLSKDI
jgi:hypothetical protein